MSEESIRELLQGLAKADVRAEAPAEIEAGLRKAFRARRNKRVWRKAMFWTASAAAFLLVIAFVNRKPEVPVVPAQTSVVPTQTSEVVTDFFPLIDPAPPFRRGRILRVELPASAMRMVGLPVHEQHLNDPVQADVLIGEEGLPRAIRFVKFEKE
jgi:hypothetical protein